MDDRMRHRFGVLVAAGFLLRANIHALVRERMQKVLATHFASTVEFSDFDVTMFPRMHVTITGLVLRHKGRTDIPPLIEVKTVSMYAQLAGIAAPRPYISFRAAGRIDRFTRRRGCRVASR